MDDARLAVAARKAEPLAKANRVACGWSTPQKKPLTEKFSYFALMAPVGALVADAVRDSAAGLPDQHLRRHPGPDEAGSGPGHLHRQPLLHVRHQRLGHPRHEDRAGQGRRPASWTPTARWTPISGMAGAADGIAAVENRTLAGKIIVYPMLHDLGLIPLAELHKKFPTVAAKLDNGAWCKAAEQELLRVAAVA